MIHGVIFDFDGLILETEEPTFKSWQEIYRSFGFPLLFATFASMVGTTRGDFNPYEDLQRLVGRAIEWDKVEPQRRSIENEFIEAQPILPGADTYLQDARRLGLKVGLASNSPQDWVTRHLTRIGLVGYFDFMSTSDKSQHLKPHPELYLSALRGLDMQADEAFALEDSPLGIRSAKGAGLFCVAVPNVLTRRLDLTQADFKLDSLTDMPLEELLCKVQAIKTQRAAV
jgi:HAD superfamily hydrolase (TIGR01509 family)